jgi:hypothetical protein
MARILLLLVVQLMLMAVLPVAGKQRIPRAQKVARLRVRPKSAFRLNMVGGDEGTGEEFKGEEMVPVSSRDQWSLRLSELLTSVSRVGGSVIVPTTVFGSGIKEAQAATVAAGLDDKEVALRNAEITSTMQASRKLLSDEYEIEFKEESLGIGLQEQGSKGFPVTTVNKIVDESLLTRFPDLRQGAIVTQVAGRPVDGKPLREIAAAVKGAERPLNVRFRDPSRFFEQLDSANGRPKRVVSTSYLPANARDAGAAEQVMTVVRLAIPDADAQERQRSVNYLDAIEFQYVAQIADTQYVDEAYLINESKIKELPIVDSSAARSPPGSSGKTIYYVVGQMSGPIGLQIPPGWDLTLRGMVKGEKRRIALPYTVAYDRKGSKDGSVPPFATLIYTVKLVDIT